MTAVDTAALQAAELAPLRGARIVLTGAGGMLGRAFVEALEPLGDAVRVHAFPHEALDVTDEAAVLRLAALQPTIVLHCGGMSLADRCEREPELARRVHVEGTRHVGRLALASGARVFYPQSVFIFDGSELPVHEGTVPNPPFTYGRVKLEAERYLLSEVEGSLVVRMAGFFGGEERDKNFVGQFTRELERLLAAGETHYAVGDRVWQPTWTLDHARNTLLLLARGRKGIYNMGAKGEATFFDVATACVDALGLASRIAIEPRPAEGFVRQEPARRPARMLTANTRLEREGLDRMRPWRDALREYLARPYFDRLRRTELAARDA